MRGLGQIGTIFGPALEGSGPGNSCVLFVSLRSPQPLVRRSWALRQVNSAMRQLVSSEGSCTIADHVDENNW